MADTHLPLSGFMQFERLSASYALKELQIKPQTKVAKSKAPKKYPAKKTTLMIESNTPPAAKKDINYYKQSQAIVQVDELKKREKSIQLDNLRIILEVYTNSKKFSKEAPAKAVWLIFPPKPNEKLNLQRIMEQIQEKTGLTKEDLLSVGYKADSTYFTLEEDQELKGFMFTMATNGNIHPKICAIMK